MTRIAQLTERIEEYQDTIAKLRHHRDNEERAGDFDKAKLVDASIASVHHSLAQLYADLLLAQKPQDALV